MAEARDNSWQPAPEELTAYVDGRLDPRRHREVETWLSAHPDMAAELQVHRKLARLWRQTAPANPSSARWSLMRLKIFAHLSDRPGSAARPARWWIVPLAVGAIAATAALAFVVLGGHWRRAQPDQASTGGEISQTSSSADGHESKPAKVEPYPVLNADEVEIITMDGRDIDAIVVGETPLRSVMALLTDDEVRVQTFEADDAQRPAEVATDTPMLMVPIRAGER